MKKYILSPGGTSIKEFDETSELFAQLSALPKDRRPVFLNEKDKEVIAYLAAQAEAVKLAQAKAIEREAIDEIIREQFSKEIAERVAQKKAGLEKQRKV